jgi:NDP-sugar pyrophosphorylase family protein
MLNIVVPMAGRGTKFIEKGFTFPKPLIEIGKKPMIQIVVENLKPAGPHRFIFLCQREHQAKFAISNLLEIIAPGCKVLFLEGQTAGAACTVLLAKDFINSDDELLIANSDQFIEGGIDGFLQAARAGNADGCVMTFNSTHPKWSFVKKEGEFVIEVAEKKVISNEATAGLYYYKHGSDFVSGAQAMILKDVRIDGQFFVCPVYNEMILRGLLITTYLIPDHQMWGMGTPEDLEKFVAHIAKGHHPNSAAN